MNTSEREVTIVNQLGLHARPAKLFVDIANEYSCDITVANGDKSMDAKSIMSVLQLVATCGTVLKITATGDDAEAAVDALVKLVSDGFGE